MKIVIDTDKKRIVVPDSFFNQIDKMNKAIELGGGTKLDYVDYIKTIFNDAIELPILRKSDKVQ